MTERESKQMVITIETETGEIAKLSDGSGNEATPVSPEDLNKISQSPNGFKYVGVILHAVTNPRCVYVITASGRAVKVCF